MHEDGRVFLLHEVNTLPERDNRALVILDQSLPVGKRRLSSDEVLRRLRRLELLEYDNEQRTKSKTD